MFSIKKLCFSLLLIGSLCFTFHSALAKTPKEESLSLFRQALLSAAKGEDKEAIQLYTRALAADPKQYRVILINRAAAYHNLGNTKDAVADLDQLIAKSSSPTEKNMAIAVKYMEFDEYDNAVTELNAALATPDIKSDKSVGYLYSMQARAYIGLAQPDSALECLNKAIQLMPEDGGLYLQRAEVYEMLDKPTEAANDFEMSAKLSGIPTV